MSSIWRKRLIWISLFGLLLGGFVAAVLTAYIGVVTHRIDTRISQLHTSQASAFYGFYPPLVPEQAYSTQALKTLLQSEGMIERNAPDGLIPGEYALQLRAPGGELTIFRSSFKGPGHALPQIKAHLMLEGPPERLTIRSITALDTGEALPQLELPPKQIASFLAGRLRTQNAVPLSEMPVSMRMAAIAIEDVRFLEHHGVSLRSTLRALFRDLLARRFVEGGSTITQQLMKNLFFSNEKAVSRKLKEALFAVITEARHSKEAILEAYLNEVYMGQWGPHEIHGVSEGAQYYFNRPVSRLSLAQSATLAAIIQAPNAHDPLRHPERSLHRRNLVLKKMLDAGFIVEDEYEMSKNEPLGVSQAGALADVDYAIDLVLSRLTPGLRSRLESDVLALYLSINPLLQAAASDVLTDNIDRLKRFAPEVAEKEKNGIHLQGALIAVDVKNCSLLALQGGRSYRQTQFNRVTQGKRQPGSLFKPFVFLAAFAKPLDPPLTPLTELEDSPFEWSYDNQVWAPKNYDEDFRGAVKARDVLEKSINVPTARLAQTVGLDKIRDVLIAAGIESALPQVPSLSLGGVDVTPLELARAFTTIARLGERCDLRPLFEVYDSNGNLLLKTENNVVEALPRVPVFETINLMRGVFTHGSGKGAGAAILGLDFAGKTGTTNEGRDTWFVGFSPSLLTLVWMGYDEKEKLGLTGASAAVPMWASFIKKATPFVGADRFEPPPGLVRKIVDRSGSPSVCADPQVEYFVPGTEPSSSPCAQKD